MIAVIQPSRPVGPVRPPCSKSQAHRALFCAYAAGGGQASLPDESADLRATKRVIDALETGSGGADCGASGSTLRFALPFALMTGRPFTFTGEERLFERPMDVYERLCARHGWQYDPAPGHLTVCGTMGAGQYDLGDCASSQFLTGMMLALGSLPERSTIRFDALPSAPYIGLTAHVMARFGCRPSLRERSVTVGGGYTPAAFTPEGDWSQAAVWAAMGALGGDVTLENMNDDSLQGDRIIVLRLKQMGADVDRHRFRGGVLRALDFDCTDCPDLAPVAAAVACFCEGETRILNAGRLRVKESDRAHALVTIINDLGGAAQDCGDCLLIRPIRPTGGETRSFGDHRIAMAAALIGCFAAGPVTLRGAEAVEKSYPAFWDHLSSLGVRVTLHED
ncbi:MAG: 3-phosphoshikimate 1-carboxyvinyltransferase [Ruminococcaceae bacterium]|nr:3-phosphoshikimate 1-carboxyvinyltransferase [Oscillospiraceae bacterium]